MKNFSIILFILFVSCQPGFKDCIFLKNETSDTIVISYFTVDDSYTIPFDQLTTADTVDSKYTVNTMLKKPVANTNVKYILSDNHKVRIILPPNDSVMTTQYYGPYHASLIPLIGETKISDKLEQNSFSVLPLFSSISPYQRDKIILSATDTFFNYNRNLDSIIIFNEANFSSKIKLLSNDTVVYTSIYKNRKQNYGTIDSIVYFKQHRLRDSHSKFILNTNDTIK